MSELVIQTESLTRRYGKRRGIDDVSFAAPEGSLFGFLGPNGAGKTTTIRLLMGLMPASSGRAIVFGKDCWREGAAIKQEIGYVPGDLRLYSWMNGRDALRIFQRARRRELVTHGRELADEFQLDLTVSVRSMSRGMRQKLGLILAMAHRPRLLILDEPSSGLDPLVQRTLQQRLRALASTGHTVFFSSHTLSEVEDLCDWVVIVRDGRVAADESLEALKERAGRQVSIRFEQQPDDALQPPPGWTVEHQDATRWTGLHTGPLAPLLKWLSQQPLEDLQIGRPDLDSVFRRYYQSQ